MIYDSALYLLSAKFNQDYPTSAYPELMYKQGRPYTCLLIDSHDDFLICVPYRSNIKHKNAYLFTKSMRSRKSRSGLDYSKIVIINDLDYIDSITPAIVDQDEYAEMMRNLPTIVTDATNYVDTYINHVRKIAILPSKEYSRKYGLSTLPYFHEIMGCDIY